ncbi:MAG TPA: hypothetical protein VJS64_12555 [Pyrinomonadaceae bacterium]|nr:hypothetical protein [Pyrinomonadaceae bacterium]
MKKKPGPTSEREDSLIPLLGGWHANLIRLAHSPVVLFVNDRSLLAILAPGRDFPTLVSVFRNRMIQHLTRIGVSQKAISEEAAAMELVQIQPSNDRSVLGSMNDFVRLLKRDVEDHFDLNKADGLEDRLSEVPMGALKYNYPIEVVSAVFGLSGR